MDSLYNSAYSILAQESDLFLPIKKLWYALAQFYPHLKYPEFEKMIRQDPRFIIHDLPLDTPDIWNDDEMAGLGFFQGPRIGLVDKKLNKSQIAALTIKKLNDFITDLSSLYSTHEAWGSGIDDELLTVMKEAKSILEKVKQQQSNSEVAPQFRN